MGSSARKGLQQEQGAMALGPYVPQNRGQCNIRYVFIDCICNLGFMGLEVLAPQHWL
jgi:hypothetical protein